MVPTGIFDGSPVTRTVKSYDVSRRNEKAYGGVVSGSPQELAEARRDRLLAIGEIAAEVAHELRNALQIVSANVYLARQNAQKGPEAVEPHLAKIERSTRIAQGIVDDLMALARGEAVHAEPMRVVDLLPLGREMFPPGAAELIDDVDPPDLKVRGFDNLRVADAAIMPTIIGGNTNAPAIMIGERCADFIKAAQA
jgi:signal transduction histidine kinase